MQIDNNNVNVDINQNNENITMESDIFEIEMNTTADIDIDISSNEMNIDTPKIELKNEEDHSKLKNLEFASSGHTGFASSEDINKINQELLKCVKDEDYIHTDNNFTTEEKNKLKDLQNFSGNASDVAYEDNTGYGVDNVQDALDEVFNTLDSKAEQGDLDNLVSYNKQNKSDTQKATARKNISAKKDIVDLGEIDLTDYDDDFNAFMNTLINEGQYKFFYDVFTYNVEVVNLGEVIGQEYCSSEEGYALRYFRTIYLDDTGIFDYATDWDSFMTFAIANNTFAPKNHVHYKIISTASTIRTYLDSFNQYGEFSITSTADKEKYWVFTDYYNVTINSKSEYRRIQRYYSMSEPWKIYSRFGLYNNVTKKISWNAWHLNEGVEENGT